MSVLTRRTAFFHLDMPFHEELTFYKWTFSGGGDGPRVAIVTGVHGDELTGPLIAWKLVRYFESRPPVGGEVVIVPASNPMGINVSSHDWPFDGTDLNSLFPGYRQGETTQRIAAAIFDEIITCDYCVNIQSGTNMLDELPQLRLYESSHRFAHAGETFGLPVLWKRRAHHPLDKTLFASQLGAAGVATFSLHAGSALRLDVDSVERSFEGILSFLHGAGITGGETMRKAGDTLVADDEGVIEVVAPDAGIYLAERPLGYRIRAGETLGRIADPCVGADAVVVNAPCDGLVMTMKARPLTYEGDLIARIVKE